MMGLIVLLLWFWYWYRHTPPTGSKESPRTNKNERSVLVFLCVAAIFSALLRGFLGVGIPISFHQTEIFIAEAVTTAMTGFCIGVVGYGILRTRNRPLTPEP